jgi:hypothetical protein
MELFYPNAETIEALEEGAPRRPELLATAEELMADLHAESLSFRGAAEESAFVLGCNSGGSALLANSNSNFGRT